MANDGDSDQTASAQEQSDLGLYCLHMPVIQKPWCTKFWDIYHIQSMDTVEYIDK